MKGPFTRTARHDSSLHEMLAYCARPSHLRRTATIALLVGLLLTVVNQLQVFLEGQVTAATWARCAANFVIPLVVSNLGLLSGRPQSDRGGTASEVEPFAGTGGSK